MSHTPAPDDVYRGKDVCGHCRKHSQTIERRRRNTMYENDDQNFITCCLDCFEEEEEYWQAQWDDYYGSRL